MKRFPFKVLGGALFVILVWSVSAPAGPSSRESAGEAQLEKAEAALKAGDFEKAETLLRQILKQHPSSPQADRAGYRLGDALFYRKDLPEKVRYGKSIQAYKEALRRRPKDPLAEWALLQIGNAYRLQGKFFLAATFYQRLMREHPEGRFTKQALYGRAESYYGIGQYSLSHKLYSRFVDKYPDDERAVQAMVGVANSLYHLEKYREASESYEKLLAHPSFTPDLLGPEVRYPMAETCYRLKDYACAKERFMHFYNLYPQHERGDEALARMGDVYVEMGLPATALVFYQEVVSLYPDTDGAAISKIRMADLALKHSKIAKRLSVMRTDFDPMKTYSSVAGSKAARPLKELALYKRAQLLSLKGQHLEAMEEFRRLREKYPRGNLVEHSRAAAVEVLQKVIEERTAKGDNFKAIELFVAHQSLVSRADYQPYALYCLIGEAYLNQGMPKRAAELFRRVVEVEFPTPKDEQASWFLGKAYLVAGELEEAEKQLRAFLVRYPESLYAREARFALGKVSFLSKRYTAALGFFEAEVRQDKPAPFLSEAILLLARTHRAWAKREQAVQTYKKLLALDVGGVKPQEPWRRMAAFELADLLFEMESYKKALMAYQDTVKWYPKDYRRSWAELQIGRAFQHLGRSQDAKDAYKALAKEEGGSLWSLVAAEYRETVKEKKQR